MKMIIDKSEKQQRKFSLSFPMSLGEFTVDVDLPNPEIRSTIGPDISMRNNRAYLIAPRLLGVFEVTSYLPQALFFHRHSLRSRVTMT